MSDDNKKFNARNSFKTEGACMVTGFTCELKADCRQCNVPIAINTVKLVHVLEALAGEHKECECNDKETGTTD